MRKGREEGKGGRAGAGGEGEGEWRVEEGETILFSQLALEQNRKPACITVENDHTLSDHFQVAAQADFCATRCLRTDPHISCMLEHVA